MVAFVEKLILSIFGNNSFFATFFISMVPVIELKGAVPFGMSAELFGTNALPWYLAWLAAAIGGLVPAFVLILIFNPLLSLMKRSKWFKKISIKIEQKYSKNAQKIEMEANMSNKKELKQILGLIIFVAIPLPLTGVYTGSAIASFLSLGYWKSMFAILLGNIISGGIVVLLCTIFKGYELYVFIAFVAILILILMYKLIKKVLFLQKEKTSKNV